jgi:hypothetical protein
MRGNRNMQRTDANKLCIVCRLEGVRKALEEVARVNKTLVCLKDGSDINKI